MRWRGSRRRYRRAGPCPLSPSACDGGSLQGGRNRLALCFRSACPRSRNNSRRNLHCDDTTSLLTTPAERILHHRAARPHRRPPPTGARFSPQRPRDLHARETSAPALGITSGASPAPFSNHRPILAHTIASLDDDAFTATLDFLPASTPRLRNPPLAPALALIAPRLGLAQLDIVDVGTIARTLGMS